MPFFFIYLGTSFIIVALVAVAFFDVSDRVTSVVVRFAFGWVAVLWVSFGFMLAKF